MINIMDGNKDMDKKLDPVTTKTNGPKVTIDYETGEISLEKEDDDTPCFDDCDDCEFKYECDESPYYDDDEDDDDDGEEEFEYDDCDECEHFDQCPFRDESTIECNHDCDICCIEDKCEDAHKPTLQFELDDENDEDDKPVCNGHNVWIIPEHQMVKIMNRMADIREVSDDDPIAFIKATMELMGTLDTIMWDTRNIEYIRGKCHE